MENALRLWRGPWPPPSPSPRGLAVSRITGWCSWYNLYAAIDEVRILDHLAAARDAVRAGGLPMRVFQIDDGFTPEMGDWLDVKPQFPRGMKPLLDEIRDAGFILGPGSRPTSSATAAGSSPNTPIGSFATGAAADLSRPCASTASSAGTSAARNTHPRRHASGRGGLYRRRLPHRAARGCAYFKTDFMHIGSAYGPDRAVWHEAGLSRIEAHADGPPDPQGNRRRGVCSVAVARSFSAGLVDGIRIGRDTRVLGRRTSGRDIAAGPGDLHSQTAFSWQADPDCTVLRTASTSSRITSPRVWYPGGLSGGVA